MSKVSNLEIDFSKLPMQRNGKIYYRILLNAEPSSTVLLKRAFAAYDSSLPSETLSLMETDLVSVYLLNKYKIRNKEDFIKIIKTIKVSNYFMEDEPKTKFCMYFNLEKPDDKNLYKMIKNIRYVDRGTVLVTFLQQYIALGKYKKGVKIFADGLLQWMHLEYSCNGYKVSDSLDRVMDQILMHKKSTEFKETEFFVSTTEDRLQEFFI